MPTIDPAVQSAHEELWSRFIDRDHIILDYVGLDGELHRPTPEECLLSKPNGMSWGVPNENGSFFNGLYLEAMINRFRLTAADQNRQRITQIAEGLMLLASVGEKPGFIARGVADDGHSHFAIGSNDQTTPWLYGAWRYLSSDLPTRAERAGMTAKFIEVVEVVRDSGWQTPCDRAPFDFRSCLANFTWESAARMLWVCRAMAQLTGDSRWDDRYEAAVTEPNPSGGPGRLDICRRGMIWEMPIKHSWTGSNSVAALRGLWEMETNPERKEAYAEGLCHSAELAAESLPLALQFDHEDPRPYECDWRVINELWQEQHSVGEAVALAERQLSRLGQASPRWPYEASLIREPLFAAWVISLCPDEPTVQPHLPAIMQAIRHFQFDRLYMSQFFAAELAYYQLRLTAGGAEL